MTDIAPDEDSRAPLRDWNAGSYHRVSDPQFAWGLRVLRGLSLRGDERVLDAGCGTGRLTRELAARVPNGLTVGCDLSENMLRAAASALSADGAGSAACPVVLARADLLAPPWSRCFDVVFSGATFHWIRDHDRLCAALRGVLAGGGILEAQCGGGPNLARTLGRAKALAATAPYRAHFTDWREPWNFSSPDEAEGRLRRAGFARARCWLEAAPTSFPDANAYRAFLETVVMRPFLAVLPAESLRARFIDELVTRAQDDDPPFVLDYWRLNLSAAA